MTTLITGASKGIGRALALEAAKHGTNLFLVARSEALLIELCAELTSKYQIQVDHLAIDLCDSNQIKQLFNHLEAHHIQIDTLINNAGIGLRGDVIDMDLVKLNTMLILNVQAFTMVSAHFAKQFQKQGKGRILNVASVLGYFTCPHSAAYAASKSYVLQFSKALRQELSATKVTVSTLCPGLTNTQFIQSSDFDKSPIGKGYFGLMRADKVARIAYRGLLKKKAIIVPGWYNKLFVFLSKFMPEIILAKVFKFIS